MVAHAADKPLVIGYYSTWKQKETEAIGFSKYTHVIISFAEPFLNGSFAVHDFDVPDAVNKINKDNAQALVSIGGWSYSTNFSTIMANPTTRTKLASSIVDYVGRNKLAGIDIDWEFPGSTNGAEGNKVNKANDTPNYLKFLQELRKKLDSSFTDTKKLITMAVGVQPFNVDDKPMTDLTEFAKVVDYANLMLYDLYGSWSKTSGPNAPLDDDGPSFMSGANAWKDAKWPANQLIAGFAFYGHAVTLKSTPANIATNQLQNKIEIVPKGDSEDIPTPGSPYSGLWQYNKLRTEILTFITTTTTRRSWFEDSDISSANLHWHQYWDNRSMTPYLVNNFTRDFISYDDSQSIQAKVQFAKALGMAGGMVWSMHMDYKNELIDVIRAWNSADEISSGQSSYSSTDIIQSSSCDDEAYLDDVETPSTEATQYSSAPDTESGSSTPESMLTSSALKTELDGGASETIDFNFVDSSDFQSSVEMPTNTLSNSVSSAKTRNSIQTPVNTAFDNTDNEDSYFTSAGLVIGRVEGEKCYGEGEQYCNGFMGIHTSYSMCSNGQWVNLNCGEQTSCVPSGKHIYCGRATPK
ncbi:hypothetical protein GGH96_001326 [Coemansia sp. RSA 1972]|nr:hypothetical protein GGH96_001326 [Coemansia sp. RSA 1972]